MITVFKPTGFTPTANAVYPLFSTCGITGATPGTAGPASGVPGVALPQRFLSLAGIAKLLVSLTGVNASTGSINWYKSNDRGTTWLQLGTQALTFATNVEIMQEFLVEPYDDFKVEFNNSGGTNQTASWSINISGTDDRAAAV